MTREMQPIWDKSRNQRKSSGVDDVPNDLSFLNLNEEDKKLYQKYFDKYSSETKKFRRENEEEVEWFDSVISEYVLETFRHLFEAKLDRSQAVRSFDRGAISKRIFFYEGDESIAHVAFGGAFIVFSTSIIKGLYKMSKKDSLAARKSLIEFMSHELYHYFGANVFDRLEDGSFVQINGFDVGKGFGTFLNEGLIELFSKKLVRDNGEAFGMGVINSSQADREYRYQGGYPNSESLIEFLLDQITNFDRNSAKRDQVIQSLERAFFLPLSKENSSIEVLDALLLGAGISANVLPDVRNKILLAKSDAEMGLIKKELEAILYPNLS